METIGSDLMIIFLVTIAFIVAVWKGLKFKEKAVNYKKVPEAIQDLQGIINQASKRFDVPKDIISAVAWVENNGTMMPDGSAGEKGIMQLKKIAVQDVRLHKFGEFPNWQSDRTDNINAGTAYLKLQYDRTGNWESAIKAYNQGERGAKANPNKAQAYYEKVSAKRTFFK